jgi:hypothetical protein
VLLCLTCICTNASHGGLHGVQHKSQLCSEDLKNSIRREARGILPLREGDTEGRVMDLVAADPDGGPLLLIDVTVADPLRTAAESAVDRGHATRVAEVLKRAKYADHPPNDTLIPAAVESFGCLGAPFQDLLRMCARRAATTSRVRDGTV